jgi:hypothetical protein
MPARRLIETDKAAIVAALAVVGIKCRVRVLPNSMRVCFDGFESRRDDVATVLNRIGIRLYGGKPIDQHSFNQPHELFVHCRVVV